MSTLSTTQELPVLSLPRRSPMQAVEAASGVPMAVAFVLAQVALGELISSQTSAHVGYRLLAWTEAGIRTGYVVHIIAFFFALPLNLSQIATVIAKKNARLFWALGTINVAQQLLMLITGYAMVARSVHLSAAEQIYHEGTLTMLVGGIGFVFGLGILQCARYWVKKDLFMYKIWNVRVLWLTSGFVFHRLFASAMTPMFPELSKPAIICASFGLSSIWAFILIEYGIVTNMLRHGPRKHEVCS